MLLLLKRNNTDSVTNDLNIVERTYSEFADLYARACSILAEDVNNQYAEQGEEIAQLMESTDESYLACKEQVCNWLLLKDNSQLQTCSLQAR